MHTRFGCIIVPDTDVTCFLIRFRVDEHSISSLVLNVAWNSAGISSAALIVPGSDRAWNITLRCKLVHLEVVVRVSGLSHFDLQVGDIDWVANWISLCKSRQSASLGRFQVIDHAT